MYTPRGTGRTPARVPDRPTEIERTDDDGTPARVAAEKRSAQGDEHWQAHARSHAIGSAELLFLDRELPVSDEDLEAIVRMALEPRRRVKEQQKRCFKSEFRNTHFSYILEPECVEQFVSTPELHSDKAIEAVAAWPSVGRADRSRGTSRMRCAQR